MRLGYLPSDVRAVETRRAEDGPHAPLLAQVLHAPRQRQRAGNLVAALLGQNARVRARLWGTRGWYAYRARTSCVGARGKLPCASGTYSTQEADTSSPYAQCRGPGACVSAQEPTGHAKPAGHALLLNASLQVKPSGHRSRMAQCAQGSVAVSVMAVRSASIDTVPAPACCTMFRGG